MKIQNQLYILSVLIISACFPSNESKTATQNPIQYSPVVSTPSLTSEFQPSQTMSSTLPATLNPQQTEEMLKQLLLKPQDCPAPCFWGIAPEKTSLSELENIITHLGLPIDRIQNNGNDFYGTLYNFSNGISILMTFPVQSGVVMSTRIKINLQGYQPSGLARDWQAYSPETLIQQYGYPSSVEFSGSSGEQPFYHMIMRFDTIDMIVEYSYGETNQSFNVCPLSDKFFGVRLWFGKKPLDPPYYGIPLEQATKMSMSDFSDLLLENSEAACFNLDSKVFQ